MRLLDPKGKRRTLPEDSEQRDPVDKILLTPDADLRAHRVAVAYGNLGRQLSEYLNYGLNVDLTQPSVSGATTQPDPDVAPISANWFHFATWATRTVERNITPAKRPGRVANLAGLRRAATPAILMARSAGSQYAGRWLMYVQLRVFLSTVPPAIALLETMAQQHRTVDKKRKKPPTSPPTFEFSDHQWEETWQRAAEPEATPVRRAVQGSLSRAFQAYLDAQWHALHAAELERELSELEEQYGAVLAVSDDARREAARLRTRWDVEDLTQRIHENDWVVHSTTQERLEEIEADEHHFSDTRQSARREAEVLEESMVELYQRARDRRTSSAQHTLYANLLITAVEQSRVDEGVTEVIDFWPHLSMDRVEQTLTGAIRRSRRYPERLTAIGVAGYLAPTRAAVVDLWAKIMTDQVLVLSVPGETLRLGRDLKPAMPGQRLVPWQLRRAEIERSIEQARKTGEVDHPDLKLSNLLTLLDTFDRAAADGTGSAARDWRRFSERMSWAVALLRSRQLVPTLRWPPFSEEDTDRIDAGKLPLRGGDAFEREIPAPFGRPEKRNGRTP